MGGLGLGVGLGVGLGEGGVGDEDLGQQTRGMRPWKEHVACCTTLTFVRINFAKSGQLSNVMQG